MVRFKKITDTVRNSANQRLEPNKYIIKIIDERDGIDIFSTKKITIQTLTARNMSLYCGLNIHSKLIRHFDIDGQFLNGRKIGWYLDQIQSVIGKRSFSSLVVEFVNCVKC